VVLTVGSIHGGDAFNVLANRVTLTGTVRTLNEKVHKAMRKLIEKKVAALCGAHGVTYGFTYEVLGYPLHNSDSILELCRVAGERVAGKGGITFIEKPSMGGEDFAEYLRSVPGCFVFIGAGCVPSYPWHNERFDIDESALPRGAEFLAEAVRTYLA